MNKGLERIKALLDPGSFNETGCGMPGEGLVTGMGKIDGQTVCVYAHDPELSAGAMSEDMTAKVCALLDLAVSRKVPFIELNESAGARIQDGIGALAGLGEIFRRQVAASGIIPQIAACFGSCAGGAVYSSALADLTIMVRKSSYMYLTGPSVVKAATGEVTDHESLGGADVHGNMSGVAHLVAEDEAQALQMIRDIIGYLCLESEAESPEREDICHIVPQNPSKSYDMHELISCIADKGSTLEIHKGWARNILCILARICGRAVGIVANQPAVLAGALDGKASRKAAGFIRLCNRFGLPLITLADVPGFLCGSVCEHEGIITDGAGLLYEYAKAEVPKITVSLRKSYGGAHIAMCCRQLGGGAALAWPEATLAVMGKGGAGKVLHEAPDNRNDGTAAYAAEHGYIDEIIRPEDTRNKISEILAATDK